MGNAISNGTSTGLLVRMWRAMRYAAAAIAEFAHSFDMLLWIMRFALSPF